MYSLLIDLESTGVDTTTDRITEIGAQLVDEDWSVLASFSQLVMPDAGLPLSAEVKKVTGLTDELLAKEGKTLEETVLLMLGIGPIDEVTSVVAFNRSFDEELFKAEMLRNALSMVPKIHHLIHVPWLCAMVDIDTNYLYKSWRLAHLALEYGVTVNPKVLHRAVNDVDLMRQLLIATGKKARDLHSFQQIPWILVRALIPAPWEDGGKGRDEAKKMGYAWEIARGTDGPRVEKAWLKRIKAHMLDEEIKSAPFKVRQIKETL